MLFDLVRGYFGTESYTQASYELPDRCSIHIIWNLVVDIEV